MSYSDPDYFYIDTGYQDPLDPREDYPTQEEEDREAERWKILSSRRVRRRVYGSVGSA